MECIQSFVSLLSEFRCVFTEPGFQIFVCLATGWVLSHRRRFVTELIWSSGCTRRGHHSRYHRSFSRSVWELDMLSLVLAKLLVRGDSAYGGQRVLRKLPANVEWISHVHPKGTLYEPAPAPAPNQKGRHRKKGRRLPGMAAWADDPSQPWQTLVFDQFGLHATLAVKTIRALYYKAGQDRLLVMVLVRDMLGKRPDQMFYCTRLDGDAQQILSAYAGRWSIEVTFENSKQLLGLEDPANRKEKAVRRTAPMALVLHSLIVVWFHQVGHRHLRFPDRPWYPRKHEPSFADMLTTLRRLSWQDKFHTLPAKTRVAKRPLPRLSSSSVLRADGLPIAIPCRNPRPDAPRHRGKPRRGAAKLYPQKGRNVNSGPTVSGGEKGCHFRGAREPTRARHDRGKWRSIKNLSMRCLTGQTRAV